MFVKIRKVYSVDLWMDDFIKKKPLQNTDNWPENEADNENL